MSRMREKSFMFMKILECLGFQIRFGPYFRAVKRKNQPVSYCNTVSLNLGNIQRFVLLLQQHMVAVFPYSLL
jgi:hypothetical protein